MLLTMYYAPFPNHLYTCRKTLILKQIICMLLQEELQYSESLCTLLSIFRYGMVLKQRANFYNNIATEMIPCQKPMLLQDAQEFERVRVQHYGLFLGIVLSFFLNPRFAKYVPCRAFRYAHLI